MPESPGCRSDHGLGHRARGRCFTVAPGCLWQRGQWWRWFTCRSKRLWFPAEAALISRGAPQIRYRGRLIEQERGLRAVLGWPLARRRVVWTDPPKHGWGAGPAGTSYYLCLWTRWTWLHPRVALRPEAFTLEWPPQPATDG